MLAGQQAPPLRGLHDGGQERRGDVAGQQAVPILGEGRRVPDRGVHRQPDEPAVEQIEVQLLHQLALAADGVEHLQQQGAEQLLRGNRRAPIGGIQGREPRRQVGQDRLNQGLHGPEGVVRRNPVLQADITEQLTLAAVRATHVRLTRWETTNVRSSRAHLPGRPRPFSATC